MYEDVYVLSYHLRLHGPRYSPFFFKSHHCQKSVINSLLTKINIFVLSFNIFSFNSSVCQSLYFHKIYVSVKGLQTVIKQDRKRRHLRNKQLYSIQRITPWLPIAVRGNDRIMPIAWQPVMAWCLYGATIVCGRALQWIERLWVCSLLSYWAALWLSNSIGIVYYFIFCYIYKDLSII